jgi:peptidoglycan/xylan/chitin deacetylase (PgdA/CDA1 family)
MPRIGWGAARAFSFALYYSGGLWAFRRLDRSRRPGPRCTVLNYHRVFRAPLGYHDIAVAPDTFRKHLDHMLRHDYGFLSLAQYEEYLAGERVLERDSVVLTFDDGYRDNYTAAFPLLRESRIPAAVFLCTGPVETGVPLWWDRVEEAVRGGRSVGMRSLGSDPDIPGQVASLYVDGLTGSDRSASVAIGRLVDTLKALPAAERQRAIAALERQIPPAGDTSSIMMTWGMVREMHEAGVAFGAHSVTHPAFSELTPESARAEIEGSRRSIEEHIGAPVTAFAYPYGKEGFFDDSTIDALKASGIRWAYTTVNGRNEPGADPYVLRRDGMRDVPAYVLAVRLAGVFELPALARLRARIERGPATRPDQ